MTDLTTFDTRELGDIAQARAALCSFLNIPLITLPDVAFVERMRSGDVDTLLGILDQSVEADVAVGASLMRAHIDETRGEDPLTARGDPWRRTGHACTGVSHPRTGRRRLTRQCGRVATRGRGKAYYRR